MSNDPQPHPPGVPKDEPGGRVTQVVRPTPTRSHGRRIWGELKGGVLLFGGIAVLAFVFWLGAPPSNVWELTGKVFIATLAFAAAITAITALVHAIVTVSPQAKILILMALALVLAGLSYSLASTYFRAEEEFVNQVFQPDSDGLLLVDNERISIDVRRAQAYLQNQLVWCVRADISAETGLNTMTVAVLPDDPYMAERWEECRKSPQIAALEGAVDRTRDGRITRADARRLFFNATVSTVTSVSTEPPFLRLEADLANLLVARLMQTVALIVVMLSVIGEFMATHIVSETRIRRWAQE